jgi:hypothetical protein
MKKRPLDSDVADLRPPIQQSLHTTRNISSTYLPILDAHEEGADWRDVARIVLQIDPERGPERARRSFESHLSRARWLTQRGYRASAARPASRIF